MRKVESHGYAPGERADRSALAEITNLIDDGAYEAASVTAWEVQRDTPGDPAVWLLLTRIDFLRERHAGAMYAARMATRLDPSSAEAWLWLARTAVTRARWRTEGMDAALQATALAPENPQTWTALAQLHVARDACYEAAVAAERAVRVAPDDVEAHRTLGLIAAQAGEWSHAAAAFRRALALAPNDVDARAGLIQALEAQHIDPSDELRQHGSATRDSDDTGRVGQLARDLSQPGPLGARPGILVVGALACAGAGAGLGLAVPAIGLTRGLVGAVALALMWLAIWPLRQQPRRARASPAVAGDAPSGTGRAAQPASQQAVAAPPAATARLPADATDEPAMASARVDAPSAAARTAARAPAGDAVAPPHRPPEPAAPAAPPPEDEPSAPAALHSAGGAPAAGGAEPTPPRPSTDDRGAPPGPGPAEQDGLPADPGALLEVSKKRLAEFDLSGARAAASRLSEVAPDSLETHRALGAVSLAEQDYHQAEWHYGKVLEIEPLDEEAHERLEMAKQGRRREEQHSSQRPRRRRG